MPSLHKAVIHFRHGIDFVGVVNFQAGCHWCSAIRQRASFDGLDLPSLVDEDVGVYNADLVARVIELLPNSHNIVEPYRR